MQYTTKKQALKGKFTLEYRAGVRKWELMEGTAHRGLYQFPEQAVAAMEALG